MDVGDLLARDGPRPSAASEGRPSSRQHSTRHSLPSHSSQYHDYMYDGAADAAARLYADPPRPSRASHVRRGGKGSQFFLDNLRAGLEKDQALILFDFELKKLKAK